MYLLIFKTLFFIGLLSSALNADITSNLEAHYTFNNTLDDASGNGHTLSIAGGGSAAYELGQIGNAYTLNGADNELFNSSMGLSGTTGTVSFWVKLTDSTTQSLVIMGNAANNVTMDSFISSATTMNAAGVNASGISILDDSWHNIVFTFNGTTNLYIDNVFVDTDTSAATLNSYLQVGGYNNTNGLVVDGAIDNLRIYSRVLTAGDRTELFNESTTSANAPMSPMAYLVLILTILSIGLYKNRQVIKT